MVSTSFPLWKEYCIYKGSKVNIMKNIGIDTNKKKLNWFGLTLQIVKNPGSKWYLIFVKASSH